MDAVRQVAGRQGGRRADDKKEGGDCATQQAGQWVGWGVWEAGGRSVRSQAAWAPRRSPPRPPPPCFHPPTPARRSLSASPIPNSAATADKLGASRFWSADSRAATRVKAASMARRVRRGMACVNAGAPAASPPSGAVGAGGGAGPTGPGAVPGSETPCPSRQGPPDRRPAGDSKGMVDASASGVAPPPRPTTLSGLCTGLWGEDTSPAHVDLRDTSVAPALDGEVGERGVVSMAPSSADGLWDRMAGQRLEGAEEGAPAPAGQAGPAAGVQGGTLHSGGRALTEAPGAAGPRGAGHQYPTSPHQTPNPPAQTPAMRTPLGPVPPPSTGALPTSLTAELAGHEGPVLGVRFNRAGTYCLSCGKVRRSFGVVGGVGGACGASPTRPRHPPFALSGPHGAPVEPSQRHPCQDVHGRGLAWSSERAGWG